VCVSHKGAGNNQKEMLPFSKYRVIFGGDAGAGDGVATVVGI